MPDYDPNPTPNIVIHPGDILVGDAFEDGAFEYRLFNAAHTHYATLVGHRNDPHDPGFPGGADANFVIDNIRFISAGGGLLPVRAHPQPDPGRYPFIHLGSVSHRDTNSVNVSITPFTYTGDPPLALPTPPAVTGTRGTTVLVTISHDHEHPHTRDDDALAFSYRHTHSHSHTGPDAGTLWLSEHEREAHDHDHPDQNY